MMPRPFTCSDFCNPRNSDGMTHPCHDSSMRTASRYPRGDFSFDVQSVLLAVFCPRLFQRAGLVLRSNSESCQRQNQGTHANVGFCRRTRSSTFARSDNRCLNVAAAPNPLKHTIQFVSQANERRHRNLLVPLRPQPDDHFWKPGSLCVARRHLWEISSSIAYFGLSAFVIVVALHDIRFESKPGYYARSRLSRSLVVGS